MSILRMFLPTASNGSEFELRRWLSPPFPRRLPAAHSPSAAAVNALGTNVYTSLRELIVSSPSRPFTSPTAAGFEIQIRNPLVKQAAYAYLQMTPPSIRSQQPHSRFLLALSDAFRPLRRCFGYIGRLLCCSLAYNAW
ncbi:hypothetical protein KFK09_025781 [Dendrobium nobile]|uniref:Uncharacterized protein n=1 Tax=Dendrobium nobile TaxID=94219 RepID=A0A8T3A6J2_DENNO|nr:hypothetical protein KFK09_025781 [Dendrobium nobile]